MIRIYDKNETDFTHNGIGILKDVISCTCKEELNGKYELEFEYQVGGAFYDYIVEENIVKAPVGNPSGDDQLFRIKLISRQLKKIKVYAVHIFYDLADNFLADVAPTNKGGNAAIAWMLERTDFPNDFIGSSDIQTIASARYVRKNFVEALIGSDNAFVNTWGGELYRNNKTFAMNINKGVDRGVQIRYRKNMKEINWDIDITGIVTRIYPGGFDGLTIPEHYIDSPLINNYIHPIIKKLEFTDIKIDEDNGITEAIAQQQLRVAVQDKYNKGIDKPLINIEIDFLELSKTDEYKALYQSMERIYLGDFVTAVVPHLNLNEKLKVVSATYDVLAQKYIEFELSNNLSKKKNFINNTNELIKKLEQVDTTILDTAKNSATAQIVNAMGGKVYKTRNELYIMDSEDPSTARKVWRWNINGLGYSSTGISGPYGIAMTADGQIVADFITTGTLNANLIEGYQELLLTVSTMDTEVSSLQTTTSDNTQRLNSVESGLSNANSNINTLSSNIQAARTKLDTVESGLNTTNTNLSNLSDTVDATNENLSELSDTVDATNTKVNTVESGLNTTNTNVANLNSSLNTTNTNVSNLTSGLNTTNANVSNLTTSLNTTNTNLSNLSDDVDTLEGNLNTTTNTANSALSKANSNAGKITTLQSNVSQLQVTDNEIRQSVQTLNQYVDDQIDEITTAQETKYSEIDLREDAIESTVSSVSELTTSTSNNLQELSQRLNDYTPNTKTATLEQSLTTLQTNTYTKTEINTKLTDGSVTKVQTVSGTFDENGMHYAKTNAPTNTTINEVGVGTKKTDSDDYVLFAGYVDNNNTQYEKYKGQTIVASENMLVSNYLVIGEKSRLENYENGTGIFVL